MSRPSIALVLGAGGVVGGAYHAGTLAALAEVTGWDPRDADLVVGTSAGAGIAATLRAGLSAADHLARARGRPLSPEGLALAGPDAGPPPDLGLRPDPAGSVVDRFRPAAPWLLAANLLPGRQRPGVALAAVLPAGRVPTAPIGDRLRDLVPSPWPDRPTWICAVRLGDGRRVVFGRDDVETPDLARAVEASIAVPGLFTPVEVGGQRFVDGGAWSPTNADLVAGLGFDLVIVVSTMSALPGDLPATPAGVARLLTGTGSGRSDPGELPLPGRYLHSRVLAREVQAIRQRGGRVLSIQPTAECRRVMGLNPMASDRVADIADQAHRSVGRLLGRDDVADRVALLARAAVAAP